MEQKAKIKLWDELSKQAKSVLKQRTGTGIANGFEKKNQPLLACGIKLDYSKQLLSDENMETLLALSKACFVQENLQALMQGAKLNSSENKAALHTALRALEKQRICQDDLVYDAVNNSRKKIQEISKAIRQKNWLGKTGQAIRDVVNIGIGGSDLGPRFCLSALKDKTSNDIHCHFISDADPLSFAETIQNLEPETTLFIISSKSFTTVETIYNAKKAKEWIGQDFAEHFIAVTANPEKAQQFGIEHIIPIWDWVGGRFSFCSAINLISAIALGYSEFERILQGAETMDNHIYQSKPEDNLAVMMALLGVWNINFLAIPNLLVLCYAKQLEQLVPYIQQLDMESNGKSIDRNGNPVDYATGPLVFGGLGNQIQHSFYQLICQGTHPIAADLISLDENDGQLINAICKSKSQVMSAGVQDLDNPYGRILGNIPLNHISIERCSSFSLGALVALYEHKIFTQSVIWNINPFDQPGVEAAKQGLQLHPAWL